MEEKGLNIITYVSVAIIVVSFFIAWAYTIKQKKDNKLISKRRWIEQLPSFISTLGVLGTFIGITIGLYFFNTDDLDHSIPKLLSGLKTAFFTSLAGMIGSLVLSKIVNSSFDENDGGVSDINQAAGEICKAVAELREQISKAYRETHNYTCERCGIHIDNPFEQHYIHVHHRNGNKVDNRTRNLECLCIRCHANIDTNHQMKLMTGANKIIYNEFCRKYEKCKSSNISRIKNDLPF